MKKTILMVAVATLVPTLAFAKSAPKAKQVKYATPAHSAAPSGSRSSFSADAPSSSGAPNYNVRVSPLGMLKGAFSVQADIGISDRITVGPTLGRMSASVGVDDTETKIAAYEIGVKSNLYLSGRRFESGWIASPYVAFAPSTLSQTLGGVELASASMSGLNVGALAGYQWVTKSGLNFTGGAGVSYYTLPSSAVAKDKSGKDVTLDTPALSGIVPNLELTVGYAF